MKVEIVNEKENPFMGRKEIIFNVHHQTQPTPTNAAVQAVISRELGKEPVYVEIKSIFSKRGIGMSEARVFVWNEPKVKDLEKEASAKQPVVEAVKEKAVKEVPKEEAKEEKAE